mgnify:CR=1 FL=1|tara:strand:- start:797 stop:1120 length:324 start_codon:yes stop_codon:yes gene_type:complete
MERFIIVSERANDRTIRINVNSIMCYYPSYDDRGIEIIEYTTIQLTGNKVMCKLDVDGMSSELDQYFILLKNDIIKEKSLEYNHILNSNIILTANKGANIPEDYKMD